MAAHGEGLALGRTNLLDEMVKSGRLVIPLDQKVATEVAFYLMYASSNLNHPQPVAFKGWLLEINSTAIVLVLLLRSRPQNLKKPSKSFESIFLRLVYSCSPTRVRTTPIPNTAF